MKKTSLSLFTATCLLSLSGCVTTPEGLEPIQPKYSAYSWVEKVDTLKPKFEWMPYESTLGKQNFRYQLRIIDGNVVRLFKDDIHDTYYVVEDPLLPNKVYQWDVRAAWTNNGKTEGESWSDKKYVYFAGIVFGAGTKPYTISTPNTATNSNASAKQEVKPKDTLVQTRLSSTQRDDVGNLEKLSNLHKNGIISDEEYSRKKKEILDRM